MIQALRQYRPARSIPALVSELNQLYHEHEAAGYDSTHPEIFEQLPPLWSEMLAVSDRLLQAAGTRDRLRVLDYGCGTGFAASQCLSALGAGRIARLVCYDPSEHMLGRCERTLNQWGGLVEYTSDLSALGGGFDLLLTNSVLHHIVNPAEAIRRMMPRLAPGAVWISGHEPSRRYFQNRECVAALRRYRRRRLLSPRLYWRRALRWTGVTELPGDYAARVAFERSLFERRPPARLIQQLVDYHVVESGHDLQESKGLDFQALQAAFAGDWELVWRRTYSFLGPHYEGGLPAAWRVRARDLAQRYPDDGANCCLLWRRGPAQDLA